MAKNVTKKLTKKTSVPKAAKAQARKATQPVAKAVTKPVVRVAVKAAFKAAAKPVTQAVAHSESKRAAKKSQPSGVANAGLAKTGASWAKAPASLAKVGAKVVKLKGAATAKKAAPTLSTTSKNAQAQTQSAATAKSSAQVLKASQQPLSASAAKAAAEAAARLRGEPMPSGRAQSSGGKLKNIAAATQRDLKKTAPASGASFKDRNGTPAFNSHGEQVCREVACEALAISHGYCRMHYIKNWKKIQAKQVILKEKKLNRFIEELVAKYPDKYIEAIRFDLTHDHEFAKVIMDLDLDESVNEEAVETDGEEENVIDTIRRDFEEGGDAF